MTPESAPWSRSKDNSAEALGPGTRRARQVFRPQDVLAILIAAMGHDVGHPGLSNAFMVGHEIAPLFAWLISRKTPKHPYLRSTTTNLSWKTCTACLLSSSSGNMDSASCSATLRQPPRVYRPERHSTVKASAMCCINRCWLPICRCISSGCRLCRTLQKTLVERRECMRAARLCPEWRMMSMRPKTGY